MAVLHESPWYQEILREGEIRGERRGIISSIEVTLERKFGSDGLQLMPQIEQISDLSSLKAIMGNAIAATTLEEVQRLL